jgi:hypothetical protein
MAEELKEPKTAKTEPKTAKDCVYEFVEDCYWQDFLWRKGQKLEVHVGEEIPPHAEIVK